MKFMNARSAREFTNRLEDRNERNYKRNQEAKKEQLRKQATELSRQMFQAKLGSNSMEEWQANITPILEDAKGKGVPIEVIQLASNMTAQLEQKFRQKNEDNDAALKEEKAQQQSTFFSNENSGIGNIGSTVLPSPETQLGILQYKNAVKNSENLGKMTPLQQAQIDHYKTQDEVARHNMNNPKPKEQNEPGNQHFKHAETILMNRASDIIKSTETDPNKIRFNEVADENGNIQITVAVKDGSIADVKDMFPEYDVRTLDQVDTELFDTSWVPFHGDVKGKQYTIKPKYGALSNAAKQAANTPALGQSGNVGLQNISNKNSGPANQVQTPPGVSQRNALDAIVASEKANQASEKTNQALPADPTKWKTRYVKTGPTTGKHMIITANGSEREMTGEEIQIFQEAIRANAGESGKPVNILQSLGNQVDKFHNYQRNKN